LTVCTSKAVSHRSGEHLDLWFSTVEAMALAISCGVGGAYNRGMARQAHCSLRRVLA
jgi:hypothetical protein